MSKALIATWLAAGLLPVAQSSYSNLVTNADGSVVLFEAQTGFVSTAWHEARRLADGKLAVRALKRSRGEVEGDGAADLSADGSTVVTSFYGKRSCGFGGSTCFLAAPCRGSFAIQGPETTREVFGHRTLARLTRDGRNVWLEQTEVCRGLEPEPPVYQGLYRVDGLQPLFPRGGFTLASKRSGRRSLTDRDQALVFSPGGQLHLVSAAGARVLRHVYGADEAVIDAQGRNVVYVEGSPGRLRWIDVDRGTDEDLASTPLAGGAPMLGDDGRVLAFLSPDGRLHIYRRETRTLRVLPLPDEPLAEFVLSGDGRAAFAVNRAGRLLRVDVGTGEVSTWLEPFPALREVPAPYDGPPCPLVCYGPVEPPLILGAGSLVVLKGAFGDAVGWRVRAGDFEWPLRPVTADAAWFQAPYAPDAIPRTDAVVEHPDHPILFRWKFRLQPRVVTCFGALHENFDRLVTPEDPARAGEVIHLYLTGLQGVEAVPYGEPNPLDRLIPVLAAPLLGGEGAFVPLFFGLAPGLVAMQQLDLRVTRAAEFADLRLFLGVTSDCRLPPTAP